MHRNRAALAILATAGLIAAGCGSDDDTEPTPDAQPEAAQVEKAKPKRTSVRARMIDCIDDALGYDVTTEKGPHELSVEDAKDKLQAVIVIHPDAGAARNAVARTLSTGTNAVVFGRAELIQHAAGDTETGVLANCVATQYNRPRR